MSKETNSPKLLIISAVVVLILLIGVMFWLLLPEDKNASNNDVDTKYTELPAGEEENIQFNSNDDESNDFSSDQDENLVTKNDINDDDISDIQDNVRQYSNEWQDEVSDEVSGSYVQDDSAAPTSQAFVPAPIDENTVVKYGYLTQEEFDDYNSTIEEMRKSAQARYDANSSPNPVNTPEKIVVTDIPFNLSDGKSCGSASTDGFDSTADPEDIISEMLDNSSVSCLGEAYVDNCRSSYVNLQGQIVYLNNIADEGCHYGVSSDSQGISNIGDISFCPVLPSATFLSDLTNSNIDVGSDEVALAEKFDLQRNLAFSLKNAVDNNLDSSLIKSVKVQMQILNQEISDLDKLDDEVYSVIALNLDTQPNCKFYNF